MTIINRALHKAYKRRSDAEAAPDTKQPSPPTVSGWASKLREPIRPLTSPLVAAPVSLQPASLQPVSPQPDSPQPVSPQPVEQLPPSVNAVLSGGTKIRIDAGHSPTDSAAQTPESTVAATPHEIRANPVAQVGPVEPSQPVEQWSWPPIVQRLLTCPAVSELRDLAIQLRNLAADQDLRCVAFSGHGRKVGRTSLVLTLASVLIADKKTSVAIVDADFAHPDAAQLISLNPAPVLKETSNGPATADGVVTTLIAGRLAIVPLAKPVAAAAIDQRRIGALQTCLRSLRREYDVVLIDAGPIDVRGFGQESTDHPPHVLECRAIDAMISVCRTDSSQAGTADEQDCRQPGLEWLGSVETFAKPQHLDSRHN